MRKNLIYFVFVAIAIAGMTTVSSCKKGENDPFISLKSRKARITGEWKLSEGTLFSSSTGNGSSYTSTTTYTESTATSNGNTYAYTETLTIDKDGTYEVKIMEDGASSTVSGNWFFAGKIKEQDLKNKEAIMLVPLEYSEPGYIETYTGLYGGDILLIDQLKNKELIFKGEFSHTSTGYSSNSTYDRTFEKKK